MFGYNTKVFPILVALTAASIKGQDSVQSVLVDDFGMIVCGDLQARTDAYAAELRNDLNSKAFILIYPPKIRPELANRRQKIISSTLRNRGIEPDRFSFYLAPPNEEIRTQFWKVAVDAELPVPHAVLSSEAAVDTSRPFMFGYEDEHLVCPTFVPGVFAKLILENPGSRGHIVIREGYSAMLGKYYFAEEWINELVKKHGVPRKRLRLFFPRERERSLTTAEFWFVPARKK